MTTKILALTNALGNLVRFRLMQSRRYDSVEVSPLIDDIAFAGLIGAKAFDSNALVAELNNCGSRIHPASDVNAANASGYVRVRDHHRRRSSPSLGCA